MKRITPLILAVALIFTVTACGQNPLEKYLVAVDKTGSVSKGQLSVEVAIESDFNQKGLTNEEIKQLNYFKYVQSKTQVKYDEEENKSITMIYSNFGGMGFDSELYQDGDKVFIKMPIEGKYLDLNSLLSMIGISQTQVASNEENYKFMSEQSIQAIEERWKGLLNKEDVVVGKSSLLNTENGEVKVTLFTISLTDKQIKTFLNNVMDILSMDNDFKNMLTQSIKDSNQSVTFDEISEGFKKMIEEIEISDLKYEVYIDIDDYIVESNIQAIINYSFSKPKSISSQKISIKTQNWDIEKEQEFIFPELTDENTLDLENLDQGMPFMLQDLFNFNEMEGK